MSEQSDAPAPLKCRPLDKFEDIFKFIKEPPAWRTLCTELRPHSSRAIRNIELCCHPEFISLEKPATYCHFNPDEVEVRRHDAKKLPKTLVCHDMANGYHDDSVIDGTGNYDAYSFYNWAGVDIFCYFSHHLVTIPPLGWINVGHAHGVKVIGTIISEWAEGAVFWDAVLETESSMRQTASALTAIARTLRFDGWLLNVENKVTQPGKLLEFVRLFHRTLHEELAHAELIWYDSVTIEGHLNWQNQLNDKNKAYFYACDGFFTNYSWVEEDVAASARAAGDRLTDLYLGIDVWGRNFHGGGQFNTREAIKLAHGYGCSLAIFAPAWTHEAMADPTDHKHKNESNTIMLSEDLNKYDCFLLRDRALWDSIWPYLNTRLPCELPFQTSFCRGQGKKLCIHGEVLCPSPWYNLRRQQYQPNAAHGAHGYLLSAPGALLAASRHALDGGGGGPGGAGRGGKRGILKLRESLYALHASEQTLSQKTVSSASSGEPHDRDDDDGDELELEDYTVDNTTEAKPTLKHRIKEALKHICRKKPRRSSSPKGENSDDEHTLEASPSVLPSSGRSMQQMSVNIKLGQSALLQARLALAVLPEEKQCLQLYLEDGFSGGSCLKIHPSDRVSQEHRMTRLFHCDFECEDTLVACVVTKTVGGHADQTLNVMLNGARAGAALRVTLVGRAVPQAARAPGAAAVYLAPLQSDSPAFRKLQKYLVLCEPGFYVPLDNAFGWQIRYYEIREPGLRVSSVNCRTGLPFGPVLLGHFGLCARSSCSDLGDITQTDDNTTNS